jgi:hypothetical protein
VRDLGLGGACIEVREVDGEAGLAVGSAVLLELTAPTLWDPLTLSGRIVWTTRESLPPVVRAGIAFQHESPTGLFALFQLLGLYAFEG